MNVLGNFYTLLAARLLNIKNEEGVSIIQHIDFWNQQFNEDWKSPFGFPAVFLEYKTIPWQTVGRHKQLAELQFDLHIASTTKAKSQFNSQFTTRWLEHLQLIDAIHYWLSGFNGTFFGSISRTGLTPDHFYGDIINHVMSFRCTMADTSAMRVYTRVEGDILVLTLPPE
ncbi:MAG: hypothetical protein Q8O72_10555 [Bacteroidales bacterium]|nr:hypothetical protein [Bacteroidales bacterium]